MNKRNRKVALLACFIAAIVPNLLALPIIDANTPRLPAVFVPHQLISQLTGREALNDSSVVDVMGCDLGIVVKYQGFYHFIFGDTFGGDYIPHQATADAHWRSNVMAYSNDTTPGDGIVLNGWIVNEMTGFARELFAPKQKIDQVELTTIPTGAITDGNKFYIYYMDINHWGEAGEYFCNNGSIAASTDGVHFTRIANVSWPGDSNFVMFGHVQDFRPASIAEGMHYLLATPAGRYGSAYLLRVPQGQVLNMSAYEYFTGTDTSGDPSWSPDMWLATPVINRPVGEISVMWDEYLQRFITMYIEHYTATIILRTAEHPWGPWSAPVGVAPFSEYWGLYGSFMHPDLVEDGGRIVYFIMSIWGPYNTFVMKADLTSLLGKT
nr:DUF4185 domain-containing protein [Candidatus Sigynarchaeota archaeon]